MHLIQSNLPGNVCAQCFPPVKDLLYSSVQKRKLKTTFLGRALLTHSFTRVLETFQVAFHKINERGWILK